MINNDMRVYDYLTYGDSNAYGQPTLSKDVQGSIKIAIYITNQTIQDNINYHNCSYVGLTTNKLVNDKFVILYNGERLKVKYVNPTGRFKQVFMEKI